MKKSATSIVVGWSCGRALLLSTVLALALNVQAQDDQHSKTAKHAAKAGDTASCIKEAAQMNTGVIQFAQLASQKAQSSELKQFSRELEKDHQKAQTKLEAIAQKHNVTLPTTLDQECKDQMAKLKDLSGSEFDKEFAKGALQGHAMALTKLNEAANNSSDSDFATYAKDMLPKVKAHQQKAREVAKAVGLDDATIAKLEAEPPAGVGTSGQTSQSEHSTSASEDLDKADKKSDRDNK